MNQQYTDREIIGRVLAGETDTFGELVDRYQHMVYTLAMRMLRNRELAEETAQDVFVKAYQSLDGFRGSAKFSTWLYKIAYHRILDVADREKRRQPFYQDAISENPERRDLQDTWTRLMEEERRDLVGQALERLEPDDRSLLSLFYLQEQSLRELAEITGLREGTVKVRLFRARERLKESLSATAGYKILNAYER